MVEFGCLMISPSKGFQKAFVTFVSSNHRDRSKGVIPSFPCRIRDKGEPSNSANPGLKKITSVSDLGETHTRTRAHSVENMPTQPHSRGLQQENSPGLVFLNGRNFLILSFLLLIFYILLFLYFGIYKYNIIL